jgi:xylulose-5-phosphate/fructose-6-phosphate phosphoketolase
VIDRVPTLGHLAADTRKAMQDKRVEHKAYIAKYGDDQSDIRDWKWDATR